MLVRPEANIRHPLDLEGKRVGVRAYSVTTGVWTRGIYYKEYGLDTSKVTWVVDDEEHVQALKLPPNVEHVPEGKSLAGMMAAGEIDAGLAGNAGIGRSGDPSSGGWKQEAQNYPDLFPNAAEVEAEWYRRTGIYPMHGTIVVKESVLEENPGLARALVRCVFAGEGGMAPETAFGRSRCRHRPQIPCALEDRGRRSAAVRHEAEHAGYRSAAGYCAGSEAHPVPRAAGARILRSGSVDRWVGYSSRLSALRGRLRLNKLPSLHSQRTSWPNAN